MSRILIPPRPPLFCLYCGNPTVRGTEGEHIVPVALGGRRTLNDARVQVAVCRQCNTGALSRVDSELATRSYLSVLTSQRLNATMWQVWDIDHRANELLDALPVWSPEYELLAFECRPQIVFAGARTHFYAAHQPAAEYGNLNANRALTRAVSEAFRRLVNGGEDRFNFQRVDRQTFPPDVRHSPRVYPSRRRTWQEIEAEMGDISFTFRFCDPDDMRRAFQSLWRVACDGQAQRQQRGPFGEVRPSSPTPAISINFETTAALRGLWKISLNLIAAHCRRTGVSYQTFGHVARMVRDVSGPGPSHMATNGFVPPSMLSAIAGAANEHVFRLVHTGQEWQVYHSYFGGVICAFVSFPGPSEEGWKTLEVVAPLNNRRWGTRLQSSLFQHIGVSTTWGPIDEIIPSVPVRERFMRFEVSIRRRSST